LGFSVKFDVPVMFPSRFDLDPQHPFVRCRSDDIVSLVVTKRYRYSDSSLFQFGKNRRLSHVPPFVSIHLC